MYTLGFLPSQKLYRMHFYFKMEINLNWICLEIWRIFILFNPWHWCRNIFWSIKITFSPVLLNGNVFVVSYWVESKATVPRKEKSFKKSWTWNLILLTIWKKKPQQHKMILIFIHFCASIFEQCNGLGLWWGCSAQALGAASFLTSPFTFWGVEAENQHGGSYRSPWCACLSYLNFPTLLFSRAGSCCATWLSRNSFC